MKYIALIATVIAANISAMETELQITNRHLDTLERPYITIINKLPQNDPNFPNTRIDISDQTKVKTYTPESYRIDDSTKTIYSNNGIRFSPQTHKSIHEFKRLGMNDAENAAIIAMYIHGALRHRCLYMVIGKGAAVQFGDVITFSKDNDNNILLKHNDKPVIQLETIEKTAKNCQLPQAMSEKAKTLLAQYSKPRTSVPVIQPSVPLLIGLLNDCILTDNNYIKGIVTESLTHQ